MNLKPLYILLSVYLPCTWLLISCHSKSPVPPQAKCDPGDPKKVDYIERDNNRCEGLKPIQVSAAFNLVSLSTGNLTNDPKTISIKVPALVDKDNHPKLEIQSPFTSSNRLYLLDEVK